MDQTTNELIYLWRGKIKDLLDKGFNDEFFFFFLYYMCLDAWVTNESGLDGDGEKIRWLVSEVGILKDVFADRKFDKSDLVSLKTFAPIEDMRPNHRGDFVNLQNIENFEEVIRFIYQIRCNLFHGAKSPANVRDKNLVDLASKFLKKWIECAHLEFNS